MRLGLNYVPVHSSPEEWAEILSSKGYRAARISGRLPDTGVFD